MIVGVSLRLFYLIFVRLLHWLLLLGRTSVEASHAITGGVWRRARRPSSASSLGAASLART
jgi:hypothetical protein